MLRKLSTSASLWNFAFFEKADLCVGKEYCIMESFQAECTDNQVIMMTGAEYGVMERNRCVNEQDIGKGLFPMT